MAIRKKAISMGHARALLPLVGGTQVGLAQRIAAQGLSVREAERLAAKLAAAAGKVPGAGKVKSAAIDRADPDLLSLQNKMSDDIGLDVEIKKKGRGGEIKIKFSHPDELESFLRKLGLAE